MLPITPASSMSSTLRSRPAASTQACASPRRFARSVAHSVVGDVHPLPALRPVRRRPWIGLAAGPLVQEAQTVAHVIDVRGHRRSIVRPRAGRVRAERVERSKEARVAGVQHVRRFARRAVNQLAQEGHETYAGSVRQSPSGHCRISDARPPEGDTSIVCLVGRPHLSGPHAVPLRSLKNVCISARHRSSSTPLTTSKR